MLGNCWVYAKYGTIMLFKAFSIENNTCVDRLIYASTVDDSDSFREFLQEVTNDNKSIALKFQLRETKGSKVVFETK